MIINKITLYEKISAILSLIVNTVKPMILPDCVL